MSDQSMRPARPRNAGKIGTERWEPPFRSRLLPSTHRHPPSVYPEAQAGVDLQGVGCPLVAMRLQFNPYPKPFFFFFLTPASGGEGKPRARTSAPPSGPRREPRCTAPAPEWASGAAAPGSRRFARAAADAAATAAVASSSFFCPRGRFAGKVT